MKDPTNISQVSTLLPDYMGFIFFAGSPRFVGTDFNLGSIDLNIKKVGVFVDEEETVIDSMIKKYKLDLVQLHGAESTRLCANLRLSGVKVIKVFSVDDRFDFQDTTEYEPCVDFFLFDTKGKSRGGNGVPFDWRMIDNYNGSIPFFISGGVSTENILELRKIAHPLFYAVDVNSGVELSQGIKDVTKVEDLISKLNYKKSSHEGI